MTTVFIRLISSVCGAESRSPSHPSASFQSKYIRSLYIRIRGFLFRLVERDLRTLVNFSEWRAWLWWRFLSRRGVLLSSSLAPSNHPLHSCSFHLTTEPSLSYISSELITSHQSDVSSNALVPDERSDEESELQLIFRFCQRNIGRLIRPAVAVESKQSAPQRPTPATSFESRPLKSDDCSSRPSNTCDSTKKDIDKAFIRKRLSWLSSSFLTPAAGIDGGAPVSHAHPTVARTRGTSPPLVSSPSATSGSSGPDLLAPSLFPAWTRDPTVASPAGLVFAWDIKDTQPSRRILKVVHSFLMPRP